MAPTISGLIASAEGGDPSASDALFAALYSELHALARRQLSRGPGSTLGTTTLLHEAYLNIAGREGELFADRGRFMGYAAKVMRRLVIDYARSRQALKRGGGFALTAIDEDVAGPVVSAADSSDHSVDRSGRAASQAASSAQRSNRSSSAAWLLAAMRSNAGTSSGVAPSMIATRTWSGCWR